MQPTIKYVVGDRRRRYCITPHIVVDDYEFVGPQLTMREAQELCKALVGEAHPIIEQATKKMHEVVDIRNDVQPYEDAVQ